MDDTIVTKMIETEESWMINWNLEMIATIQKFEEANCPIRKKSLKQRSNIDWEPVIVWKKKCDPVK